ncbi:EamA family transporter [Methanoregula formicica]|uniref:EamA-like transporter family n=1 Tax=Methanoregula formicica (strain DSM 22288 / NBRC 105244 / SMSP) TaxID=593750 RepID=L0HBU6_METFS|nr:EamA family transporter [Methanoregula formicica]AGB01276.1 EamA-like transporter family [Methanoregula formicica SMSP]
MFYFALTLVVIILTSIAHLLLKKGSVDAAAARKKMYLHPLSITAYLLFAVAALLSIFAMKGLDLKVFFALTSLTYICIPLLSFVFLKEPTTRNKLLGIIIISFGVIIFYF